MGWGPGEVGEALLAAGAVRWTCDTCKSACTGLKMETMGFAGGALCKYKRWVGGVEWQWESPGSVGCFEDAKRRDQEMAEIPGYSRKMPAVACKYLERGYAGVVPPREQLQR